MRVAVAGQLLIPVGSESWQTLLVIEKKSDGTIDRHDVAPAAFVSMTGEVEHKDWDDLCSAGTRSPWLADARLPR
jgi:protein-L-isoaspartate O-methyltransferase